MASSPFLGIYALFLMFSCVFMEKGFHSSRIQVKINLLAKRWKKPKRRLFAFFQWIRTQWEKVAYFHRKQGLFSAIALKSIAGLLRVPGQPTCYRKIPLARCFRKLLADRAAVLWFSGNPENKIPFPVRKNAKTPVASLFRTPRAPFKYTPLQRSILHQIASKHNKPRQPYPPFIFPPKLLGLSFLQGRPK